LVPGDLLPQQVGDALLGLDLAVADRALIQLPVGFLADLGAGDSAAVLVLVLAQQHSTSP
jgi:hypothetical protein